MIKKIFIFTLMGIVLTALIFHHSIHTYLLKSAFQIYFESQFGHPLQYKDVFIDGGRLTFVGPSFKNNFSAEKMVLGYLLDITNRKVDLFVELESPFVQLEEAQERLRDLNLARELSSPKNSWLEVHPNVSVKGGLLSFSTLHLPLHFDLMVDSQWEGHLRASFGHPVLSENVFHLAALSHKDGFEIDLNCIALNCTPFVSIAKTFFPALDHWSIPSGVMNGKLKAVFPKDQKPYFEGQMSLGTVSLTDSMINLQLSGLKGSLIFNWMKPNELFTFNLEGKLKDVAKLMPEKLEKGLNSHFADDRLGISGSVKKNGDDLELSGAVHIRKGLSDNYDVIHFGSQLKHNMTILSGWFTARNIPLEKYISPFLFQTGVLELSGIGEFKGTLDDNKLTVKYDVDNIKLENENLLIEAKKTHSPIPGDFLAFHEIDLTNYSHHGELPLYSASYYEKNNGLHFDDIFGTVNFKDHFLAIHSLEAYCNDVYFSGSLDLDYSDPEPGIFNLAVHSPIIIGKISQMQKLLSKLNMEKAIGTLLSQLTLEGDLSGRNGGLELAFEFTPYDYRLKADIQGSISHGWLPFESADMSLKGLYLDVDYHHDKRVLEFSDIQGSLLIGKPRQVEEYQFVGNHIRFIDIKNQDVDFDVSVKDQDHELMRIVASTKLQDSGLRHVNVNQSLSHVSRIYPQTFVCRLYGSDFEAFKFESFFDLQPLVKNLSRFQKSGLLCFSPQLIEKIAPLDPVEGKMRLNIAYQPSDKSLEYSLVGSEIEINSPDTHHLSIKGKRRDNKWIVDQFQWDKLNAFAEFQPEEDKWKVNSLGFNDGETLLLGLQGDFFPEQCLLNAKVNLCVYKGEIYDLKNLEVKLHNDIFQFSTHTNLNRYPFQIISQSRWPAFDSGNIVFNDQSAVSPMRIFWVKDNNEMFLKSIQGEFAGLRCDLISNDSGSTKAEWNILQGKVEIDFNSLSPLFTNETEKKIQGLGLGSTHVMEGFYWINPKSPKPLLDKLFFRGKMTGVDTTVKGYQFSRVEAGINYSPDRLEMNNLTIDDPSGTLFAPSIIAARNPDLDDWFLQIPQTIIKKFRPSVLYNPAEGTSMSPRFKNLVFKKIDLQNFNGYLSDLSTWKASGGLHFQNTARKNFIHPLFAIPNEIILRLGLDPSVLNPVTGNIYFNLQDGRFYLNKMKDVYSEGRGSKFYLSDYTSSWMDMDGNLSVRIRMKQYNLIFKIAELFTVTIEGDIRKPTYTLQKAKG